MDAWMHYDWMLPNVFWKPGAYPYPFGSDNMARLYERSDDDLRRLSYPRLRDQAVSVDEVFCAVEGTLPANPASTLFTSAGT